MSKLCRNMPWRQKPRPLGHTMFTKIFISVFIAKLSTEIREKCCQTSGNRISPLIWSILSIILDTILDTISNTILSTIFFQFLHCSVCYASVSGLTNLTLIQRKLCKYINVIFNCLSTVWRSFFCLSFSHTLFIICSWPIQNSDKSRTYLKFKEIIIYLIFDTWIF